MAAQAKGAVVQQDGLFGGCSDFRWRELRLQNDLTLGDLASRSELTRGFLSQVERNLTMPEFFVDEQAAKRTMKFC